MNLYVGNLSSEVKEADLQSAFEAFGQVSSVKIIEDRFSGQSRGFGFVEMPSKNEANAAIDGLNDTNLKGKNIVVNEAREKKDNRSGGKGRRGGGFGNKRRW